MSPYHHPSVDDAAAFLGLLEAIVKISPLTRTMSRLAVPVDANCTQPWAIPTMMKLADPYRSILRRRPSLPVPRPSAQPPRRALD